MYEYLAWEGDIATLNNVESTSSLDRKLYWVGFHVYIFRGFTSSFLLQKWSEAT